IARAELVAALGEAVGAKHSPDQPVNTPGGRGEAFAVAAVASHRRRGDEACLAPTGGVPPASLPLSEQPASKASGGTVAADEASALAAVRLEVLAVELAALDEPAARAAEQEAQRAAGMAEADLQRALADAGAGVGQAV